MANIATFIANNVDDLASLVLKRGLSKTSSINPKNLGFICPGGSINFLSSGTAQKYAKNRVLQALRQKNPFERAVYVNENRVLGQVDGTKLCINASNINCINTRYVNGIKQGFNMDDSIMMFHGHPEMKINAGSPPLSGADYNQMLYLNLKKVVAFNRAGEINSFERVTSFASKDFTTNYILTFSKKIDDFHRKLYLSTKVRKFIDKFNSRIQRYQKEGKSIPKVMQQYIEKSNTKYNNMLLEKGGSSHYNTMYHNFLRENASSFGVRYETNFSNLV